MTAVVIFQTVCTIACCLGLIYTHSQLFAASVSETALSYYLLCWFLCLMAVLVTLSQLALSIFCLASGGRAKAGVLILFCFILNAFCLSGAFRTNENAEHTAYARAMERARPLISAISAYKAKTGHCPETLTELIPEYLARVPDTGLASVPQFKYVAASKLAEGNWELQIDCVKTDLSDHARLFFRPSGVYPQMLEGWPVTRVGQWGFVQERF